MEEQKQASEKPDEFTLTIPPTPVLPAARRKRPWGVTVVAAMIIGMSSLITAYVLLLIIHTIFRPVSVSINIGMENTVQLIASIWFLSVIMVNMLKIVFAAALFSLRSWSRKATVAICIVEACLLLIIPAILTYMDYQSNKDTGGIIILHLVLLILTICFDGIPILVLTRRKIKDVFDPMSPSPVGIVEGR